MNYCYGKGVWKSVVLCWEVVFSSEGPLSGGSTAHTYLAVLSSVSETELASHVSDTAYCYNTRMNIKILVGVRNANEITYV